MYEIATCLARCTRVSMHSELTQAEDKSWSSSGSRIKWLRLSRTFKQRYHAGMLQDKQRFKLCHQKKVFILKKKNILCYFEQK